MSPTLKPLPDSIQSPAFQLTAKESIVDALFTPHEVNSYPFRAGFYGVQLKGGTGVGKTFIILGAIRDTIDKMSPVEGSINPFRWLYLVPGSVKIQTQRAVNTCGLASVVHVMSYGELRGKLSPYILWSTREVNRKVTDNETGEVTSKGDIALDPYWNPRMLPAGIIIDECQVGRNEGSITTRILSSIPTHTMGVKVILSSATAYGRISEARMFMILAGVVTNFNRLPLKSENFPDVAWSLCAREKSPNSHSPKNIKNLTVECAPWIVEVKNARFRHKAHTNLCEIEFSTPEQRSEYTRFYEEYKSKMRKLNKEKGYFDTGCIIEKWVALSKFREKAEVLRVPELCDKAIERLGEGKQVVIASNFRDTLRGCWKELTKLKGISVGRVGWIVGGQSKIERQKIVDKWQSGELDILLLMMKAGGVGLNLQHDRPESRPRAIILPPTYAAPEFVQVIGRVLRFTSISDVTQDVLWFKDTVESLKVLPRIAIKLKCLDAAVSAKEQWGHMFEKFVLEDDKDSDNEEGSEVAEDKLEELYSEQYQGENKNTVSEDGGYENEEGELEMIGAEGLSNQD